MHLHHSLLQLSHNQSLWPVQAAQASFESEECLHLDMFVLSLALVFDYGYKGTLKLFISLKCVC